MKHDSIALTSTSFENNMEIINLNNIYSNTLKTSEKLKYAHKSESMIFGN